MGYREYRNSIINNSSNNTQQKTASVGYRQYAESLKGRSNELKQQISSAKKTWSKELFNALTPTWNPVANKIEYPEIAPIPAKNPTVFYNQIAPMQEDAKETMRLKTQMDNAKKNYDNAQDYSLIEKILEYDFSPNYDGLSTEKRNAKIEYEEAAEAYYKHKYDAGSKEERQELLNSLILVKDSLTGEEREKTENTIKDLKKSLYGNTVIDDRLYTAAQKGAVDFVSGISKTLDATIGNVFKLFGWENNPVSKFNSYASNEAQYWNEQSANAAIATGDKNDIFGNFTSALMGLVPDIIIAIGTGGSSIPTSSTLKAISSISTASKLGKVAKASTKIANVTSDLIKTTAKNPMFWTSFTRTFGSDYEEAKSKGASEVVAYLYSTLNSSMSALIEIGGGVQALPEKLKNKTKFQLLSLIVSAVEEGEEEIIQGIISEINEKLLYDFDKPFYSDTDADAIINPDRIKQEGTVAFLTGLVGGSGEVVINSASTIQYANIGKTARKVFGAQDIISYASKSLNENIRNIAQSNTAEKISNKDLGVLYSYVVRDIDAQFRSANNIEQLNSILSQFTNNNTSQTMKNIVFSRFINRLESIDGELAAEYNKNGIQEVNTNNDVNSYNINRSDNNAGQDPGILATSGVSTTGGSSDSLRQQSENTAKLNGYVEQMGTEKGEVSVERRAGESGWLISKDNTQSSEPGYIESVLRTVSGIELSGKDTAGRSVSEKINKNFVNTIFKDKNGNLLSLYHWTKEVFDKFAKGEFGFHFGTLDAAHDRYIQTKENDPDTPIGVYKEVYLNITNPIEMSDDCGRWYTSWVAYQLVEKGIIPEQQYERLELMPGFESVDYDTPAAEAVRKILSDNGYDGIVYKNGSEDAGNYSVIALYPDQIITVAENGVLKENSGVTEADSDESALFMPENSESGITELSAENPKYDMIEEIGAQMAGTVRKTDQQRLLVKIGKVFGVPVKFANLDETIVDENGNKTLFSPDGEFDPDTGVITLNTSNAVKHNPVKFVLKHELVHFGNTNKDAYKRFVTAVKDSKVFKSWLQQKTNMQGATTDAMLAKLNNDMREQRARAGKPVGPEGALEEIMADFAGDVLFEKSGKPITALIESLQKPQRPLVLQYVVNTFEHLIGKLKGTNDGLTLELRNLQSNYIHMLKQAQKNTTTQNSGGVKYSLSRDEVRSWNINWDSNNDSSLKEQIKEHLDEINEMEPVADVVYSEKDKRPYYAVLDELLKNKFGYKIQRQEYGTILFDTGVINEVRNYVNNDSEAAAIIAAPYVLKRGKAISGHKNHKGKGNVTVTFAAPVVLNGQRGNVAVSVMYGKGKVHSLRVLTPEGKTFELLKIEDTESTITGRSPKATVEPYINSVSKHSIPNSPENVKKYSVSTEPAQTVDYTAELDALDEQFRNGEIDRDDYIAGVNELYEKAGQTYDTIKKGEKVTGNENFDDPTPQKVNPRQKVRRHVRTIIEGGGLTDEMLTVTKEQVLSGEVSYTPTSNEKNLKYAEKAILKGAAKGIWEKAANGEEKPSGGVIAIGEVLLKNAVEAKDTAQVVKLTAELSEMATRLGQATQAFSLLKRMDGISQLYYVQKTVDRLNHDLSKKHGKQNITVTINPELALQLAESKTKGDFDVSYGAIMRDIAAQVPSTFIDKYNSWRYMAMLFSPTTHIRNIVGNAIFCPAIKVKDTLAALTESATGVSTDQRTKAVIVGKEYKNFAKNDFANVEEIITGGGKMNPKHTILDNRAIFKNKLLESARKFNFDMLEKEDAIFLKAHYVRALSGYLQAQKVDLKNVSVDVLAKAREYAILEAQKATYRDASALANILSNFSHKGAIANIVTESVLPFKKTPINIIKRGIEYSPVGLIKTLTKGVYDLKTGNITSAQFIDGIAGGLTGTAIMALGMALASLGVLKGGFDDEEEDWFDKLMGHQEYSVEIGGVSYTINWAAPAIMPLFMGVAAMESFMAEDNANVFSSLSNALGSGLEPFINLSMLSGIQDTIAATRYSDADEMAQSILGNMVGSYFSQTLPTLGSKINNIIDPVRRSNYIDKTSPLPKWVQSALNTLGSKVPGLSQYKAEYVDAWGNKQYKGGFVERVFQNFLSPGYLSDVETSAVADEIKRLARQTGETSVYPNTPPKYVKFKGLTKHLTADEYTQYAIDKGQMQADYVQEAINSAKYKKLTDEQKVKVITNLYKYANAKAKANLSYSYEEINAMHDGNISQIKFSSYKAQTKKGLVVDYFLDDYKKAYSSERNGGSAVDYFITKAKQ